MRSCACYACINWVISYFHCYYSVYNRCPCYHTPRLVGHIHLLPYHISSISSLYAKWLEREHTKRLSGILYTVWVKDVDYLLHCFLLFFFFVFFQCRPYRCVCYDTQWKPFRCYRPFVMEIHRSPMDFPHQEPVKRTLMFSLLLA